MRAVADVLGPGTLDRDVIAYARAENAVLVTADRLLARRLRAGRQCRCLYLRDLGTAEVDRVAQLLPEVVLQERVLGERFWMSISREIFAVGR